MPVTIGLVAAGTQAAVGLGQALFSGRKKKEADLNAFAKQSPLAQESKSLNDYYQQALNRYQENPYQSQQYQLGAMNAQRATAQGIGALQDRRSAIGGIGRLAAGQQTAMQNLGAQAEAQRNARFGQLGQATQAKTAQERYLFDINQMTPYNRQLQLKQYAAQAANAREAAGLQALGSGLGNAAAVEMANIGTGGGGQQQSQPYYPTWYAQGTKGQQAYQPMGYNKPTLSPFGPNMTLPNTLPSWAQGY